jgi:hypothetical protein
MGWTDGAVGERGGSKARRDVGPYPGNRGRRGAPALTFLSQSARRVGPTQQPSV